MDKYITEFKIRKFSHQKQFPKVIGKMYHFYYPCIGYILNGSVKIFFKGIKYEAKKGDLIYISNGIKYYSVWSGNPDIDWLSIDFKFSNPLQSEYYGLQIIKDYDGVLFHKIYNEFNSGNQLSAMSLFYSLLDDVYKKMETKPKENSSSPVVKAIEYLEKNYTAPIKIEKLASLCGFSESRFYALFKLTTGLSPIQYKNYLMVQNATILLTKTDMSVSDIAEQMGCSSANYFTRVFKSVTGKSPISFKN